MSVSAGRRVPVKTSVLGANISKPELDPEGNCGIALLVLATFGKPGAGPVLRVGYGNVGGRKSTPGGSAGTG